MPFGRTVLPCAVLIGSGFVLALPARASEPAPPSAGDVVAVTSASFTPSHVAVSVEPAVVGVTVSASSAAVSVSALGSALAAAGDGTWTGAVTVPALAPYGSFAVPVVAVDANGLTASYSASVGVDDAPPAAVGSLSVAAVGPGSLLAGWSAPAANGGSPVTSYDVVATPSSGDPTSTSVSGTSARLDGLDPSLRYVVTVAARNAAGPGAATTADALAALGVPSVPDAPSSLAVVPADRSLTVSWDAPPSDGGSPVTSYQVRAVPRSSAAPSVLTVAGSPVVVPGLVNGETYDVSVLAVNATGTSLPAGLAASPRTVPSAPVLGAVTPAAGDAVVRWSAPLSDGGDAVASYVVTASNGLAVTVPATTTSATVAPLPNGTPVTFTVRATNAAGPGAVSKASPPVTPRLPGKLAAASLPAGVIVYGTQSTVVASLTGPAGIALPGQRVELLGQRAGTTTWSGLVAGVTGSDGRVTLRATLPATMSLRLHHPASAVSSPDVLARVVSVRTRLSAASNAPRILLGQSFTAGGTVAPSHPAGSPVQLQRYSLGVWRTVAYGRMATTSVYRVAWRPGAAGTYTLRVVKPADRDHNIGYSPSFTETVRAESAADVARAILANRRITLETTHDSGIRDLATARQNSIDVSYGRPARRSSYQNAPGGYTRIDLRVLKAIRRMGQLGSITVSEIAGGSHAVGSRHYAGRAFDVSWVNGQHVAPGSSYSMAISVCRSLGAAHIWYPAYDPVGGHSNHVHCEW
jgi:hypothetical protein